MSKRTIAPLVIASLVFCLMASDVLAADGFASPAFDQRWRQDEQITPNFWGPLDLASPGIIEAYAEGTAGPICQPLAPCPQYLIRGKRLVQYFDKGRMELTAPGAAVTSGLLVREMISGRMQTGDLAFENRDPARISVAGDPDNLFPLYSDLTTPLPPQPLAAGAAVQTELTPSGPQAAAPNTSRDAAAAIATTDNATGFPLPRIFADFRERVGLSVVGLAITQPFWVQVKVAGEQRLVLMQAFERRVLTYNAANPDPFKVEFGNVGRHYYRWRYGG
ncbi:MAG: hypothetical protein LC793_05480 [Thermomicrobia bacterium]|nr:hypothetical protein [Thermomicrobia bacterium]